MTHQSTVAVLALALAGLFGRGTFAALVNLSATADATLYEDPSGSLANGSGSHLFAGMNSQGQRRRGLVRFDLAGAVPSGAVVLSATMTLHLSQGPSAPTFIGLHRVLGPWGEGPSDPMGSEGGGAPAGAGDVTWTDRVFGEEAWTTPGGDFDLTASAGTVVEGVGFWSWSSAEMAADAQAWLENPLSATGWILVGDESLAGSARRFDSRENIEEMFRPMLVIEYAVVPAPAGTLILLLAGVRRRRRDTARR